MVNKLIDGVSYLKAKFQTDELDEKLNEAVSEENWQASTQLLHQIANASYNYEKEQRILAFLWDKLKHKSWKKVLKALHLTDFLLKYGPSSLITSLRENVYEFRNFDSYTLVEGGIDRGESIRKQSKIVVQLLSDDHYLSDQRAKAKQIKDRMANVIGSAAYYGSFSNDAPSSAKKQTYESYSASNFNKSTQPSFNVPVQNMSFGESVMRTLQQARKGQQKVEVLTPPVEKPPNKNKLDLSKMNERKPEEKKNFNSLAMKLVKPPEKTEKKPVEKKVELNGSNVTTASKPQAKPASKVNDIMDLDFLSLSQSQPPKVEQKANNVDTFDFLGGVSVQQPTLKSTQSSPPPQKQTPDLTSLTIGLLSSEPPKAPITQQTAQQAPSYGNNGSSGFNYQQTGQIGGFTFNQSPVTATQNFSISLSAPQTKSTASTGNSLIDFSNFREQLTQLGHTEEKKSTLEWNW